MRRPAVRRDERGSGPIEPVLTICATMIFVVMVGVLLLWQLTNGVVHSAADSGVRAGSRIDVDSVAVCEARARQALVNTMPGVGERAEVDCSEAGGVVYATIRLVMSGGIAPFSTVTLNAGASARKEVAP